MLCSRSSTRCNRHVSVLVLRVKATTTNLRGEATKAVPTIFLLRHSETVWNFLGWFQGQLDSPLTTRGIEQADHVARLLSGALCNDDPFCSRYRSVRLTSHPCTMVMMPKTCSTPPFYGFAARRTPVLPLTSAQFGSPFPSGQAGSPRTILRRRDKPMVVDCH
ncbi:histidine phosphatase family protein [Agrobacterium tumefaciens]|nr:histidine phosphatase family protein [Agrobacterium tumefaciens]NTE84637.1 histidine phosphatase family protein [Agrobacterium tumefaciens]